jgi:predicted glycogen debranching enzyme
MDAKLGDEIFTPRHGKAVEINALWLSALALAADWCARFGLDAPGIVVDRGKAYDAFPRVFWNAEGRYLYDCVSPDGEPDASIRPNQLLAVSLPHAPIRDEQARAVVDVCRRELLTPFGLRTLAPGDASYRGRYEGGWHDRDGAYHQGTAWAWLLGPYIDALMCSAEAPSVARGEAQQIIDTALGSLDVGAIGTVSEIFDGDAPHEARGCIAQAWSVAEILRVKRAHGL